MTFPTDIQIAQSTPGVPIVELSEQLGISKEALLPYGHDKAKINTAKLPTRPYGKLILVTAMTPTPAGEGKTTTSIGLADGLRQIGHSSILALREPSLGPVFGMKGGATGGGYAQVIPMDAINLHFTGDFHAITSANNLIAATLDNHIHFGNELSIDVRHITWKRVMDMNDRQLREIVSGLGRRVDGFPREDHFQITVASEIMAVLCLAEDLADLKVRLGQMIVAYSTTGEPVTVDDLGVTDAAAILLKDALLPNLVQTLEGTPAIIHGGPFANIAHGCNSVIATKTALQLADYTVTEAGFGSDLGAEKFMDIKCRSAALQPDVSVVVATIRALKMHGGIDKSHLNTENIPAVQAGLANLIHHINTLQQTFGQSVVVALNQFPSDTASEIEVIQTYCQTHNVPFAVAEGHAKGGKGMIDLAKKVVKAAEDSASLTYAYPLSSTIEAKLTAIIQNVYGGKDVILAPKARRQARQLTELGYGELPICMAKTQYSLSDDPKLINAPKAFTVTIRELIVAAGAGFIVALTGDILTMPGLPKSPAALKMKISDEGNITGLS